MLHYILFRVQCRACSAFLQHSLAESFDKSDMPQVFLAYDALFKLGKLKKKIRTIVSTRNQQFKRNLDQSTSQTSVFLCTPMHPSNHIFNSKGVVRLIRKFYRGRKIHGQQFINYCTEVFTLSPSHKLTYKVTVQISHNCDLISDYISKKFDKYQTV